MTSTRWIPHDDTIHHCPCDFCDLLKWATYQCGKHNWSSSHCSQMIADTAQALQIPFIHWHSGQGKRLQKACTGNSAASGTWDHLVRSCWWEDCDRSCSMRAGPFWFHIRRYDGARYASPHGLCIHCWLLADVRLAGHLGWHAVDESTTYCLVGIHQRLFCWCPLFQPGDDGYRSKIKKV